MCVRVVDMCLHPSTNPNLSLLFLPINSDRVSAPHRIMQRVEPTFPPLTPGMSGMKARTPLTPTESEASSIESCHSSLEGTPPQLNLADRQLAVTVRARTRAASLAKART